ncbi:hypothetical protein EV401DRAFT_1858788 [Pisolithus croceorrhizus]|nr:hypothetical protein EV401DRAFT_1858788 [Pisolithus croceorrhizus]
MSWRLIGCSVVVAILAADLPLARTGNKKFDYLFGATLGTTVLQAIRFLLLVRPLEEYRHEADKVPAYQLPFIQRYFWLFKMTNSPRGIGWSFKSSLIPVDPRHRTRASFIASRLQWLFSHYLLLEAATLYTRCNPVFLSEASVTSQGYVLQCLNVAAIPCQLYALLTCVHCTLAVLAVGANLDEPQAWPQPFGHWKNAYTVRKFWGKTWHQMSRHVSARISKPKEREPWGVTYRRLCYAFMCSAFMHVCGDVLLQFRIWDDFSSTSTSGTTAVPNIIGYSAPYFILQPVGVLVEDAIIELGKRMGLKESTWARMVGYVWVWVFTSYSLVFSMDALKNAAQAGYLTGEGAGARATLIEMVADRVFGVQLAAVMSSWLSRM